MLTELQKVALVAVARAAVTAAVLGTRRPAPTSAERFPEASGAFVTLKYGGHLRGCIGTLECRQSLVEEVARVAVSAAREDSRFTPIRPPELDQLHVEVSVLGPLEEIDALDPSTIEIGRHGLVVEQGHRRGLLLPQVATEWNWDRETFLAQTCIKAGLPPRAWLAGARVCRFSATVFGDRIPHP